MVRLRALDAKMTELTRAGAVAFHASSYGEEAAILGAAAAVRDRDWIFAANREIGAALWRGASLEAYVHHMFGTARDPAKGHEAPEHFTARVARFASMSAPTGTQITHAVGFAWAAKIRKDDVVVLVYFGDGATSSGEFHNGANFAGVFKAPCVLFCRNNGRATSLSAAWQTVLAEKGVAYGIPGVRCDGNDALAVLSVTREAVARAAAGLGPTLIEAVTGPRDPDPIVRLRRQLETRGMWSDAKQADLDLASAREIDAAVAAAQSAGLAPRDTLFDDVYREIPWSLREQRGH
jgi:2-oxoisovalerate dehydrogenase E1 component alpha subunit